MEETVELNDGDSLRLEFGELPVKIALFEKGENGKTHHIHVNTPTVILMTPKYYLKLVSQK